MKPSTDDVANRELSIEELETISAGSLYSGILKAIGPATGSHILPVNARLVFNAFGTWL